PHPLRTLLGCPTGHGVRAAAQLDARRRHFRHVLLRRHPRPRSRLRERSHRVLPRLPGQRPVTPSRAAICGASKGRPTEPDPRSFCQTLVYSAEMPLIEDIYLVATGHRHGPEELSSADLDGKFGLSEGWSERYLGMTHRRRLREGDDIAPLAVEA